jgi:hypothetical protein
MMKIGMQTTEKFNMKGQVPEADLAISEKCAPQWMFMSVELSVVVFLILTWMSTVS